VLQRLRSLKEGVVPLARLQESERDYAADKIEIERLKRTLRSWQIQESELTAIEAEAQRIIEESLSKAGTQVADRGRPGASLRNWCDHLSSLRSTAPGPSSLS